MTSVIIQNPHKGTETEGGWSMGFSWGFLSANMSVDPPLVIAPEQFDAFNEGILVGQEAAISGLMLLRECISLDQEPSPTSEAFMHDLHIAEAIASLRSLRHLAHFGAEAFVAVFLLMIPGPPNLDPAVEFDAHANAAKLWFESMGIAEGSLYLGAGIDETIAECELKFTAIFRNLDQTREAVMAMGRPHWILAEWNASLPVSGGGFAVIEAA